MIAKTTLDGLNNAQLIALILASGSMPTGTDDTTLCGLKHGARYVQKVADPLLHPDYGFPDRAAGKIGFDTLFEDTFFGADEAGRKNAEAFGEFVRSGDKNIGQIEAEFKRLAPDYLSKAAGWNNTVAHFLFVDGAILNGADLGAYRAHELAAYGLPKEHPVTNAADCNAVFQLGDAILRANAIRAILTSTAAPAEAAPAQNADTGGTTEASATPVAEPAPVAATEAPAAPDGPTSASMP